MKRERLLLLLGATGAAAAVLPRLTQRKRRIELAGRTVVVTGGSRGLGLVLATRAAREGARVALIARSPDELERAAFQLRRIGPEVLTAVADVSEAAAVQAAIDRVVQRFGRLDVLINNAGIIQVGPLEHMRISDFEAAMRVHFWGALYTTLAAIPHLRASGSGRVVNIASIGGQLPVPHLAPYNASKAALTALSESLRVELLPHHILVTTVTPPLMRTGSARHARFKGDHQREHAWFAGLGALPIVAIDAERAAARILDAAKRGDARAVVSGPEVLARVAGSVFPRSTAEILSWVARALPAALAGGDARSFTGAESRKPSARSMMAYLTGTDRGARGERAEDRPEAGGTAEAAP